MTTAEPMKLEPMVPKGQGDVREFPWGRVVWTVAGHLGNPDTLTFGIVTINPGTSNRPLPKMSQESHNRYSNLTVVKRGRR